MKNLGALLCMISALVGSVFSYKCHSCYCRNSTTCNETEIECIGSQCMTACQYFNIGENNTFKTIYRGCANETLCGTKGSAMVTNMKFRFNVFCCTGHLCNNQSYELPAENVTINGVKCPSSLCMGTLEECKSDKEVNCTGSMDRCLDYRAKVINPVGVVEEYSNKGCVNSDCCLHNFGNTIGIQEIHREYLKC
ncbi:phospholipase A2 inhibitor and Ly6/PLAUR domain-containing protein-like [Anomaloglossus baeobatrachus]|uniref:phospholipase A2 inhibitor and Ly6/PLAUR domain-containing protein-like n=1 Tax=Anomaloglossus baeobatrachus TaxID=238106 RepID=UPI003F503056